MREDTKKALKEYDVTSLFIKKDIKAVEEMLNIDEKVLVVLFPNFAITYLNSASREASIGGLLFLTDKRMIFYYVTYGEAISHIVSLQEMKKIDLIITPANGDHIQIRTEDKVFDFRITKGRAVSNKIYSVFMSAYEPYHTEDPQDTDTKSEQNSNIDITEQIEKLSQLKDKGIITEEEFQTKKADLLARL